MKIEIRPSLQLFVNEMELALRRNDYKGGWHNCTSTYLKQRLRQETTELFKEMEKAGEDRCKVLAEAADVANFAMMIAHNYSKLEESSACPYCGCNQAALAKHKEVDDE